jgi:hypothetical protein
VSSLASRLKNNLLFIIIIIVRSGLHRFGHDILPFILILTIIITARSGLGGFENNLPRFVSRQNIREKFLGCVDGPRKLVMG